MLLSFTDDNLKFNVFVSSFVLLNQQAETQNESSGLQWAQISRGGRASCHYVRDFGPHVPPCPQLLASGLFAPLVRAPFYCLEGQSAKSPAPTRTHNCIYVVYHVPVFPLGRSLGFIFSVVSRGSTFVESAITQHTSISLTYKKSMDER
jgi:hypothetical protein